MRKKELVLNIADKLEISQTDALKAVDAVIETIAIGRFTGVCR